jgi:cyanophycin synthetase
VLKLENVRHCLWRNIFAPQPVLAGTIWFGDAFGWTTERLSPAVVSALKDKLPGAAPDGDHLAAPEFVASLAQHIQLCGDVTPAVWGVGSRDNEKRTADVFFSCRDPIVGAQSFSLAAQIVDRLTHSDVGAERIARMLKSCDDMIARYALDLRTRTLLQTVESLDIPWFRNNAFVRQVQLAQGHRQRRLSKTLFSDETVYGWDYAKNKLLTMVTLAQVMLPVGQYAPVRDLASALKFAAEIGYPVVLKPTEGGRGDSVHVDLRNEDELKAALSAVPFNERPFMLQSFFPGDDHRLMIMAGELAYAVRRTPASVQGDGRHTIAQLVEIENRNPDRVEDWVMASIVLDEDSDRMLARQGLTRESIVPNGHVVRLKGTANIATGGTMVDVTEMVHPDNMRAAVRAAKAIGLVVAGVDFITPDIAKSWHEVGGGICEVNTTVGLPSKRMMPGRDPERALIRAFYPDDGRIPTAMVTGTYGKTTAALMLASILSSAGHTVGCATTESIRIGDEEVALGDFAATDGASVVMRDATVTAAVLETARGGLIKRGMYLDHCDVAALLNVEREQIGIDGVETLDDMAALKRKVLDAARKAVVLNADDPRCLALAPEFLRSVRTFLFSRDAGSQALRDHRLGGGDVLYLDWRAGHEVIAAGSGSNDIVILKTAEIPATQGGLFWQHSSNAMAAAGLAMGLGIDLDTTRQGLRRYGKEFAAAQCRLHIVDEFPARVIFDFGSSPPAFAASLDAISRMPVSGRKFCAFTVVGDRPDWVFPESAAALAGHFHRYIPYELPAYRRGRKPGEIASRLAAALGEAGIEKSLISVVEGNTEAAQLIAREASAGDLVVVFGSHSRETIAQYRAVLPRRRDGGKGELYRAQA